MPIASVLSAISAILSLLGCSMGHARELICSLCFMHSTCGIFGYTLLACLFFSLFVVARESNSRDIALKRVKKPSKQVREKQQKKCD